MKWIDVDYVGCMVLFAHVAQLVERVLGKDEVTSSILVVGSIKEGLGEESDQTYLGVSKGEIVRLKRLASKFIHNHQN